MTEAMRTLLAATPLLDFNHPAIEALVTDRGWRALRPYDRVGAVYDFVRNEVAFGYNEGDELPASRVLADGIGQCNTKGTLLMALLRAVPAAASAFPAFTSSALQHGFGRFSVAMNQPVHGGRSTAPDHRRRSKT